MIRLHFAWLAGLVVGLGLPAAADAAWVKTVQGDKIEGSSTEIWTTESLEPITCGPVRLSGYCYKGKPYFYVDTDACVLSAADEVVRIRIDDQQATLANLRPSNGLKGATLVDLTESFSPWLMSEILSASRFLLEIKMAYGEDQIAEFDVDGLSDASSLTECRPAGG